MTILVGRPLDWAITATAGSGFLLFGYDQGVMSGLLTGTAFTNTFPEIDTTNGGKGSSSLQGTVVAIYEIGCFFGAIFCLIFSEYFSRRKSVWHSELMKASSRGKGLATELATCIFGVMLSYWVDYGMSYVNNDA
ncbi:hypothetical protein H9Q74_005609 [Fusarium xylarioides]|nr:hypothetical protein H9Q71_005827 [Fusarium xylarioides]KAG5824312.1 hypothetical protein H9Q74_005609 [Fusarium xylarioides]